MSQATQNNYFNELNKFQTAFYTSIPDLQGYTLYDIKRFFVPLLHNMVKGFPLRAQMIFDIYGPYVKACESPEILFALQRKFVNSFVYSRVPQYIYYKAQKAKTTTTKKKIAKASSKDKLYDFDYDVVMEIKSSMFIDNKTYERIKYDPEVQALGLSIIDGMQIEKIK